MSVGFFNSTYIHTWIVPHSTSGTKRWFTQRISSYLLSILFRATVVER